MELGEDCDLHGNDLYANMDDSLSQFVKFKTIFKKPAHTMG